MIPTGDSLRDGNGSLPDDFAVYVVLEHLDARVAVESSLADGPVCFRRLVQEECDKPSPSLWKTVWPSQINRSLGLLGDGVAKFEAELARGQPTPRHPVLEVFQDLFLVRT